MFFSLGLCSFQCLCSTYGRSWAVTKYSSIQCRVCTTQTYSLIDLCGQSHEQLNSLSFILFGCRNHEEKKAKSKTGSPKQQTGDGEPTTKKLKLDGELIKAENNLVPDKLDENPIKREEEIPSDKNQKPTPKKRKHILNFKEEMVLEAQTLSLQVMSK